MYHPDPGQPKAASKGFYWFPFQIELWAVLGVDDVRVCTITQSSMFIATFSVNEVFHNVQAFVSLHRE